VEETTANVRVVLPHGSLFYICAKRPLYEKEKLNKDVVLFRHQGAALHNTVSVFLFSLFIQITRLNIKFCYSE